MKSSKSQVWQCSALKIDFLAKQKVLFPEIFDELTDSGERVLARLLYTIGENKTLVDCAGKKLGPSLSTGMKIRLRTFIKRAELLESLLANESSPTPPVNASLVALIGPFISQVREYLPDNSKSYVRWFSSSVRDGRLSKNAKRITFTRISKSQIQKGGLLDEAGATYMLDLFYRLAIKRKCIKGSLNRKQTAERIRQLTQRNQGQAVIVALDRFTRSRSQGKQRLWTKKEVERVFSEEAQKLTNLKI